jgi:hypothetical protein
MTPPPQERPGPAEEDEPQDSILGSLPRSRPSVRSPRRDAAAKARRAKPAAAKPKTPAAGARAKRSAAPPMSEPTPGPEGDGGVEEIARAGVTTAVQVATAGLRFAGRAAGAIRESLERR